MIAMSACDRVRSGKAENRQVRAPEIEDLLRGQPPELLMLPFFSALRSAAAQPLSAAKMRNTAAAARPRKRRAT